MTDPFETFQSFFEEEPALFLGEQLKANNIDFVLATSKPILDTTFTGTANDQNFHIKIKRTDFERANQVLDNFYQTQVDQADPDYYLFSFTDEELMDILSHRDQWNPFDYQLARKLLAQRGNAVDDHQLKQLKDERIKALAQSEKATPFLLFLGYFLVPFGLSIIGYLIGRHLQNSKKILPNGEQVFTYRASDRKQGNHIITFSFIWFILLLIYALAYVFRQV